MMPAIARAVAGRAVRGIYQRLSGIT
jgi:hypothetical protein